jgi:hypothetical protein
MAQNNPVRSLSELGFETINDTPDVLVCKIEPIGPEPDDGRWIDLSINEERCRALQRIAIIVGIKVDGIKRPTAGRTDEKPHSFIEVRKQRPPTVSTLNLICHGGFHLRSSHVISKMAATLTIMLLIITLFMAISYAC